MENSKKRIRLLATFEEFHEQKNSGTFCDALLQTEDGSQFLVHKLVLATCSKFYLNLLLGDGTTNPSANVFLILNIEPQLLKLVIDFAYRQYVEITEDNVEMLAEASCRFECPQLLRLCFRFLEAKLSINNCGRIYRFAQKYEGTDLMKKTMRFIKLNYESVYKTREHVHLSRKDLFQVLRNDYLGVHNEKVVFESIVTWAEHKPRQRSDVCSLLGAVRVCLLTPHFFNHRVVTNSHVSACPKCQEAVTKASFSFPGSGDQLRFTATNYLLRPRVPDSILLAAGGWTDGRPTERIESYDYHVDDWFHVGSMKPATAYHGVASINGFIYVMGGFNGSEFYNTVSMFDPTSKEWSQKSCMNTKRCYVSSCVLDDKIYALGGYNGVNRMRSAERYDARTNQWTLLKPMNVARSDASAISWREKVYIAGGFSGHEVLRSVECYDPRSSQWTYLASMASPRTGCALVVFKDQLLVLGGFDGQERLRSVEKYSSISDTWFSFHDMLRARSNFAAVVMKDNIYVIGGFNGLTTVPHAERFDGTDWKHLKDMITCRSALIACVVDKMLYKKTYTFLGNKNNVSSTTILPAT